MGSDIKVDNKGEVCTSIERGRYRDNKEVNSIDTRVVYNKEKRVGGDRERNWKRDSDKYGDK